MDNFGVPKKINRHVLKALYHMQAVGIENPEFSDICDLVEVNMKNNVPVRDLAGVVQQSLQNMAQLGVIQRTRRSFCVGKLARPAVPKRVNPRIFKKTLRESKSKLDPNLKRRRQVSGESLMASEIEKTQKRFRISSKTLDRRGLSTVLPKVRQVPKQMNLTTDLDFGEEDNSDSACSVPASLDEHIYSQPEVTDYEADVLQSEHDQSTENIENSEQSQPNKNENVAEENTPLTPKAEPESKEVVTAEQTVSGIPNVDPNCSEEPKKEAYRV